MTAKLAAGCTGQPLEARSSPSASRRQRRAPRERRSGPGDGGEVARHTGPDAVRRTLGRLARCDADLRTTAPRAGPSARGINPAEVDDWESSVTISYAGRLVAIPTRPETTRQFALSCTGVSDCVAAALLVRRRSMATGRSSPARGVPVPCVADVAGASGRAAGFVCGASPDLRVASASTGRRRAWVLVGARLPLHQRAVSSAARSWVRPARAARRREPAARRQALRTDRHRGDEQPPVREGLTRTTLHCLPHERGRFCGVTRRGGRLKTDGAPLA